MNIFEYDKDTMFRLIEMSEHIDKLCTMTEMDIIMFIDHLHDIDAIDDTETQFLYRLFNPRYVL